MPKSWLERTTPCSAPQQLYYHAPLVQTSEKDTALLLRYCNIVYTFIHDHHSHEESHYFANIEKATGMPGLMSSSVEQHRELEAGLKALRDYANGTTPGAFDAAELRGIIDDLAPALTTHLFEEVPAILDLHDNISSGELKRIYGLMQKEAERTSSMTTAGPLVFGNQDRTFLLDGEPFQFPPLPRVVAYVIDWVLARPNRELWRFNTSDFYGNQKVEEFRTKRDGGGLGASWLLAVALLLIALYASLSEKSVRFLGAVHS
ncbi:uncharacterized protein AB675_6786 [Cyphellophora attinorum]|uniref:Hemerythrin-like domain-containing protein n=1 Tax=Cyphellophora attinorum TaxID=1664694 RepID=A0A0N1H8D7_9EURO|nr:uncharacterized protein AB675_6786 [Phialophora attinorum]KPI43206.1 hypothetical protein AB675_6786 [Phialophora attinorum]